MTGGGRSGQLPQLEADIIESLASALVGAVVGAVVGAFATLWFQRREARRIASFSLVQAIQGQLSRIRTIPFSRTHEEILKFYESEGGELSPEAAAYMDFLDGLDFFLFASEKRFIDDSDARAWVRDLFEPDPGMRYCQELWNGPHDQAASFRSSSC